ncbi:substrate-binding periplasmic protein [Aeromonas simiae]|uniref:substrate-binding periplasmic protein n=1 Tax=Aeromonas simiae TaxID=218936 RepID=UPI0005AAF169|nr:transporter substrate-binding domain-containing protein [Aeromonas simiae]
MRLLLLLCLLHTSLAHAITLLAAEVPPFVIRPQQGAPTGMAIEVMEEAARRLHEPLTIELLPFPRALSQIHHRPDALLLPPAWSQVRAERLSWVAPLIEESFVLLTDRRYHPEPLTLKELDRQEVLIGTLRDSFSHEWLNSRRDLRLELAHDERLNAQKLARGRIQGWAASWNTARYQQQQNGLPLERLVRGEELARTHLYLAAAPDFPTALAARWQQVIAQMRQDGSLARILAQYDYQAP